MHTALITDGMWHAQDDSGMLTFTPVGGAATVTVNWPDFVSMTHPEDQARIADFSRDLLAGKTRSVDFRVAGQADDAWRWLRITGAFSNDQGQPGIGGIVSDITPVKAGEARALEAATRTNQFASAVAHDLQAPLRHVSIYADMLRTELKEQIPQPQQAMLQIIEDKTRGLQDYVKVVMNVARETHRPDVGSVDVDAALRQAHAGLSEELMDRGIEIALPPSSHARVFADGRMLPIAITAVLSNALYHRLDKAAKVRVSIERSEGRLKLFVADDGPGIPEEMRSRIFDPFWSNPVGGQPRRPGMGLALAKAILLPLNADIRLHASSAEGSTFVIDLPAAPSSNGGDESNP